MIVREDLLGKASIACPSILDYTVLDANDSMFNTRRRLPVPAGLVFKWLKEQGGVAAMDKINQQKPICSMVRSTAAASIVTMWQRLTVPV